MEIDIYQPRKYGENINADILWIKSFFDKRKSKYIMTINDENDITIDSRE